uniref:Uncharacterized protein n=1 Tax=Heterorhabditis bacteriophora TaxID=37862 RepID=A0A1I7X019_HETBA
MALTILFSFKSSEFHFIINLLIIYNLAQPKLQPIHSKPSRPQLIPLEIVDPARKSVPNASNVNEEISHISSAPGFSAQPQILEDFKTANRLTIILEQNNIYKYTMVVTYIYILVGIPRPPIPRILGNTQLFQNLKNQITRLIKIAQKSGNSTF